MDLGFTSFGKRQIVRLLPGKYSSGAKQAAEKEGTAGEFPERHTSGAKALADSADLMPGINPWPTAREGFSAACEAVPFQSNIHLT